MAEQKKIRKYLPTVTDVLFYIAGGFFYAGGICIFAQNAKFAPGGLSGLALLINYLWHFPIGLTTIVLNIPLIIISYRMVGKVFLSKSILTIAICNSMIDILSPYIPMYRGSAFLAATFFGVFLGIGQALFYSRGSSSGGTDFMTMSIKTARPHLSVSVVAMIMDIVIILLGGFVYGSVDSVLYGLIASMVMSFVIDRILYGIGTGKLVIIITDYGKKVVDQLAEVSARGSTMCKGIGTYTGEEREILYCACSSAEAYTIRRTAYIADPNAFIIITDTNEVYGEGFVDPMNIDKFLK